MAKRKNKIFKRFPFLKKLYRLWRIPIVRFIAALLIIVLVISLISHFAGGEEQQQEVSEVSIVEQSQESVESSFEPTVTVPKYWDFSNAVDLSDHIASEYGIIVNATTRCVLGGKNYETRIYPASMTKIMTLIVAVESDLDLDAQYKMTYQLINKYYLDNATITGIQAGDTVTMRDLMFGAILLSAADATEAIACVVAGSEEAFVDLMNQKAEEIGCVDTHFTNTSGLFNEQNYSTLGDIALILDYAMSVPLCAEVLSAATYTTAPTAKNPEGYTFDSTMYGRIKHDAIDAMTVAGGKTGYISETKHCLASMAIGDNGEKFIVVTVGGSGRYTPINDCKSLYNEFYGGND